MVTFERGTHYWRQIRREFIMTPMNARAYKDGYATYGDWLFKLGAMEDKATNIIFVNDEDATLIKLQHGWCG